MDADEKRKLLHARFPDLTDEQVEEVKEFLDDLCELLLGVFERLERESPDIFDRVSGSS